MSRTTWTRSTRNSASTSVESAGAWEWAPAAVGRRSPCPAAGIADEVNATHAQSAATRMPLGKGSASGGQTTSMPRSGLADEVNAPRGAHGSSDDLSAPSSPAMPGCAAQRVKRTKSTPRGGIMRTKSTPHWSEAPASRRTCLPHLGTSGLSGRSQRPAVGYADEVNAPRYAILRSSKLEVCGSEGG